MKKLNLLILTLLAFTAVTFTSCVDQEFDDLTTANVDPDITPTHTIRQLHAFATGLVGKEITTDVIIMGTVVGDDSTGNIYKTLILQQNDSMGPAGVAIQLDMTNFYTEYPVGRHVFVNCKGLFIANNGGNFELGNSAANPVGRIPSALVSKYLVKGMWGQYIEPTSYVIDDPNIPTNTLIKLDEAQFVNGETGVAYATSSSFNHTIEDCDSSTGTMTLYSSSYATFALSPTPYGKGTLVGVYTVYNGAGELQIRSLRDVNMTALRCDGTNGIPDIMQVDSIRMLGSGATIPVNKKIDVIVTSNYATGMLTTYSAYVQDNSAGIELHFAFPDQHTFAVGTHLQINVSGLPLGVYNGVLQIDGVPLSSCITIGSGSATSRSTTIADINLNYNLWESQLVTLSNTTITGTGTTYGGSRTLNDGTGTITLFTSNFTTFSSITYPTTPITLTGILTQYQGTYEILIRDTSDVDL